MLQRNRSISLPKYAGDIVFQSESDFHADVYDDTADDAVPPLDMKTPPIVPLAPPSSTSLGPSSASSSTALDPSSTTVSISSDHDQNSMKIIMKIIITMLSGSVSSIFYMLLLKEDPGTSLLAAFVLHLCVIIASLPTASQHIFSPKIPYYRHGMIVCLSFGFVFLKSYAVQMLPMPIIFVMSNLQLVIGLFVGKFLFDKKFSIGQYLAVVLICAGCTLQTLPSLETSESEISSDAYDPATILMGILFMAASLLSMSIMIPFGSKLVQQYDASVQEQMFLQHFLSMPLFAMQHEKIGASISRLCTSDSYFLIAGFVVPAALVWLVATSAVGQFNRNLSMELSLDAGAMASQLVNTCHKTISLFISIFFFNTSAIPMTMMEILDSTSYLIWIGLFIQTVGSVWYVQSSYSDNPKSTFRPSKSAHRLSRVTFTGETKLGISNDDIARLRKIAYEHRRASAPNLTTMDGGDEKNAVEAVSSQPILFSSHDESDRPGFSDGSNVVSVPNTYRKRRAATAGVRATEPVTSQSQTSSSLHAVPLDEKKFN